MGEPDDPEGNTKVLLPPHPYAEAAAQAFLSSHPGARILFSQNSGQILWVDGRGAALGPSGSCGTAAQARSRVIAFLNANPGLLRITDPEASLTVAEPFLERDVVFAQDPATGRTSVRLEQTLNGFIDPDHSLIAHLRPGCALSSLVTTVAPTADPAEGSPGGIGVVTQPLTVSPHALPAGHRRVWRRVRVPTTDETAADEAVEERRLADVQVIHEQYRRIRVVRSPFTGEVIERVDETSEALQQAPEGWPEDGELISTSAPDAAGAERSILSTRLDPARSGVPGLVMGFSIPGIHATGESVLIGDAALGQFIPEEPIATDLNSWSAEIGYAPLRDATRLSENLAATVQWFADELGHDSWDGEGGSFRAGIRGDRSEGDPGPRAFGGNGFLLIEAGRTATGQPISDALDIVAHEYAHSVINATADFAGSGEAGALNEGLADVFGKA
ncbi:MAG: hypothetical protein IT285_06885, partial [Bdellovibrionales bacterium]|nr:hypothetical protein [Bdellovibrionales bacterium]